jgi:hypothetical protein
LGRSLLEIWSCTGSVQMNIFLVLAEIRAGGFFAEIN